ncbi:MAG: hypothetical protein M3237_22255 [Actinomycetota bacterium]|nr:hypothetical protein [Actinomycetota bacterium]
MSARRCGHIGGLLAVVVLVMAMACAPRTPGEDSWREDALRALSDVRSSVQVTRVAVEQAADDRIYDSYLQAVVVDAEEAAGASADTFAGFQPPRSERERYDVVTGQLDAAAGLLSEVRIAVVAGNEGQLPDLLTQLHDAAESLHQLNQDLRHPPEDPAGAAS